MNIEFDTDALLSEPAATVDMHYLHFFNPSSSDGFYWYLFGFHFKGIANDEISSKIHLEGIRRRFEFNQN